MSDSPLDRRALYLRWRPSTFDDVVGQEHVVRTLRNAVKADTIGHAYLFAGPRGTGKTSLARILFRAVNCPAQASGDPCGTCPACISALAGRSLDLIEIDAASNRGIDDVRDLREKVAFSPADVRFRVYIVDEAHELTAPAWDAFLKTLEEPPPHAIFVLATTEAHRIPSTIVSRCQRFDFRRIRPRDIRQRLLEIAAQEGIALDPEAADCLAQMARGGLRDAISLLDQASAFGAGTVDLEALREILGLADPAVVQGIVEALVHGDAAQALGVVVTCIDAGSDVRVLVSDTCAALRGLMYVSAGATSAIQDELGVDQTRWLEALSGSADPIQLRELLRGLSEMLARTRDSSQLQLQFELSIVEACENSEQQIGRGATRSSAAAPDRIADPPRSNPAPAQIGGRAARADRMSVGQEPRLAVVPPRSDDSVTGESPAEQTIDEGAASDSLSGAVAEGNAPHTSGAGAGVIPEWVGVIDWIRRRSPYVATYLEKADLLELQAGELRLRFSYRIHHDRIGDPGNTKLVEQAIQAVAGRSVRVRCEYVPPVVDSRREPLDLDDPVLKFALEKFGGRAEWVERD